MMWGWGYPSGFGWWWLMGGVWMVVFWAVVIALIIWAARRFPAQRGNSETPLEIAQKRLARGEITREEYDRIREALSDANRPPA